MKHSSHASLQGQFQRLAAAMKSLPYSLLNVAAKSWALDIAGFRSGVEDLEKQLTAALQLGYDSAGPLSAKLRLLPVGLDNFPVNSSVLQIMQRPCNMVGSMFSIQCGGSVM